jgi:hypothetical protein
MMMKKVTRKASVKHSPFAKLAGSVAKETLSDLIGIRVAPSFKTWIFEEMNKLGVPERARAEFLRGCLTYAIKASQRSVDPKWAAFASAAEGAAIEHLGARLAIEGSRDIAALGFWPAR